MTCWPSFKRNKPLSTKTQVRFLPIARCNSIATTEESTPPDKPKITWSSPICFFIFAIAFSIIAEGVHSFSQPHMSNTN